MKWNYSEYPRIELALNMKGHLILRKPGPNAVEANVFTEGQEQSLWRSIVKSGFHAEAEFITLFDALQPNGRLQPAAAAIIKDNGKAQAYEAWQLAAFKPIADGIEMRVNYGKPQLAIMSVKRAIVPKANVKRAPTLTIEREAAPAAPVKAAPKLVRVD